MAPRKSAAKKATPAPEPEEAMAEAEPTEAPETVEEPKALEAPAPAPRQATPRAVAEDAPTGHPEPYRVETFSVDGRWGWRLCAADGTVLRESAADLDSRDGAAEASEEVDFGRAVVLAGRQGRTPPPRPTPPPGERPGRR